MKPKISIITSVYNAQNVIEDAIKSVITQNYDNIEYIIIDANSKDNTKQIIQKYLSKIALFVSEDDNGIYDGLNKGFKKATGDIIGILHSDDIFYSQDTIKQIAKIFQEDKNIGVVYGNLIYTNISRTKIIRNWKSKEYKKGMIKKGWMPPHPTLFVKKEIYEELGLQEQLFDTSFKIAADYDLILRLFLLLENRNIKSYYLDQIITKMRIGGASNKSITNIIQKTLDDIKALKKNNIHPYKAILYKNFSKIFQFL